MRLFIPRSAIEEMKVLGVVGIARRGPREFSTNRPQFAVQTFHRLIGAPVHRRPGLRQLSRTHTLVYYWPYIPTKNWRNLMKLGAIASKSLGSHVEGDPNSKSRASPASRRPKPGELTFLANRKYRTLSLGTSRASAVLVAKDPAFPAGMAALRSANPYLDFARATELFHPARNYASRLSTDSLVAKTAQIGDGAHSWGPTASSTKT